VIFSVISHERRNNNEQDNKPKLNTGPGFSISEDILFFKVIIPFHLTIYATIKGVKKIKASKSLV